MGGGWPHRLFLISMISEIYKSLESKDTPLGTALNEKGGPRLHRVSQACDSCGRNN